MSIRLSGSDREDSSRRDRRKTNRESRRKRSKSPRKRSLSLSRSPRRKEQRRSSNRSESPRSTPSKKHRSRRDSGSPRRKRRSRSSRRKRRSSRRGGRSGRSRRERHRRRHSSSSSTSPVRRSRRHKNYSSSSSSSNSSETEYHHRRRRKRRDRKKRRPLIYRIGDMVLFKKRGSRRRRSQWVPVEVCQVHGGMYGEITYRVWLLHERRMLDFVRTDELRFKHHHELERRLRDDEIAHHRDELRETNYEFARDRGFLRGRRMDTYGEVRGRSRRSARAWQQLRARSAEGNSYMSARHAQHERALSVPPENTNWPHFLAEFVNEIYRERIPDRDHSGDDLPFHDVDEKTRIYRKDVRDNEHRIDENERTNPVRRDYVELEKNVERRYPPNDHYMGDRHGAYTTDVKDRHFEPAVHLNFVIQNCKAQQDRE